MNEALLRRARGPFSDWQRTLVVKNSKADREHFEQPQRELQNAIIAGGDALAGYLRASLRLEDAKIDAPPFPRPALTSREFENPPPETEIELAEAWNGHIQPAEASQPLFWYLCHLAWLEDGRFGDAPLPEFFYGANKHLDDQTRDFLRRMGGVPREIRGAVTVFVDCPMARAWWRCHVAASAGEAAKRAISDAAHRKLHPSGVWSSLMELSVRQLTTVNHPMARAVLVEEISGHDKPTGAMVQRVAGALARQGLSRSLEHTPWEELREIAARAAAEEDDA